MELSQHLSEDLNIELAFLSDCLAVIQKESSYMSLMYFSSCLSEYINVDVEYIEESLIKYFIMSLKDTSGYISVQATYFEQGDPASRYGFSSQAPPTANLNHYSKQACCGSKFQAGNPLARAFTTKP